MRLSSIIIILVISCTHESINKKGMYIICTMANPIFLFLSFHLQIALTWLPREIVRWEKNKYWVIVDNRFCVFIYFCLDNIFRKVNQHGGCTKSIFRPTSRVSLCDGSNSQWVCCIGGEQNSHYSTRIYRIYTKRSRKPIRITSSLVFGAAKTPNHVTAPKDRNG